MSDLLEIERRPYAASPTVAIVVLGRRTLIAAIAITSPTTAMPLAIS